MLILLFAFDDPLLGIHSKVGTTGSQILKIGMGARPAGMGEAYVGLADDISAIWWNPSGLSRLDKKEMIVNYTKWLNDTNIGSVGYGFKVGKKSNLGVGINYMIYGAIQNAFRIIFCIC